MALTTRTSILTRGGVFAALLAALALALALSACGSSGGDATGLLKQTFSGSHTVNSGNLNFSVNVNPSSGSTALKSPITLSFGGPFQSLGKGKLPQSDFTISLNVLGKNASIGLISTGTTGYVSLQGSTYQLPASSFQRLESSFTQVSGSGGQSNQSALSKLGINPLSWLNSPTIVGDESVAGTSTTHIRAHVNVSALLSDLNALLAKAATVGAAGSRIPTSIPAATQSKIESEVQNPSFDVWTGKSDKTMRKLAINLTLARSVQLGLNLQYANLNQPQTIQAPTSVQPYSQFQAQLRTLVSSLLSGLGQAAGGGAAGPAGGGATGTGTTPGASSAPGSQQVQNYSQCIQQAGSDITKMQRCASLINGK